MKRGFDAVAAEAEAIAGKPLPEALKAIGTKLVMKVGGASGPLYGTLFLALGKELPASPDRQALALAFGRRSTRSQAAASRSAGQKTMLDVLVSGGRGAGRRPGARRIAARGRARPRRRPADEGDPRARLVPRRAVGRAIWTRARARRR